MNALTERARQAQSPFADWFIVRPSDIHDDVEPVICLSATHSGALAVAESEHPDVVFRKAQFLTRSRRDAFGRRV